MVPEEVGMKVDGLEMEKAEIMSEEAEIAMVEAETIAGSEEGHSFVKVTTVSPLD
jgi:hypothetical protein